MDDAPLVSELHGVRHPREQLGSITHRHRAALQSLSETGAIDKAHRVVVLTLMCGRC